MCDDIIRKKSNNIVHILMGDFNLITNGHIDRVPSQHIPKPKFFNDLETLGLINSYRKLNKEELGNTYHKEGVSTRIDQIWVSETHSNKLLNFSITPSTFITSSDYDIITLTMDTLVLIQNNRKNMVYDKLPNDNAYTRVVYNCDNIEKEMWDNFWLNIKNQLNSLDQDILKDKVNLTEHSQEDIDRYWNILNGIIVNVADIELFRKVLRLHNTFKHNQQMIANEDAKFRWTIKIAKYNQDYVTSNDNNNKCNIATHDMFSEEWFDNLKTKVNCHLRADYKKYKAAKTKSIKDKIDKRVEITREDQTTWLSNILDRNTHTNIIIDKVLVNEESGITTKRLATEPSEQQIYEPAGKFKEEMESTIEKITKEEWIKTKLDATNRTCTHGMENIGHSPIPKPINFEYNILNTRPIALLDCF
uniref:DNase I-like protein n=1 Tax=Rhizophagus irregularis (strain DAOM 181602 / DAOM 197198 / MUCL 43194) TaxID=747089 RepID=U9SS93_RHIID